MSAVFSIPSSWRGDGKSDGSFRRRCHSVRAACVGGSVPVPVVLLRLVVLGRVLGFCARVNGRAASPGAVATYWPWRRLCVSNWRRGRVSCRGSGCWCWEFRGPLSESACELASPCSWRVTTFALHGNTEHWELAPRRLLSAFNASTLQS